MGFTTPCFIRKNTQELRRGLEELGYNILNSGNTTLDEHNYDGKGSHKSIEEGKAIITSYGNLYGVIYNVDTVTKKGRIDCGMNEELFLAIAALRDDTDKYQWFTDGDKWIQCPEILFSTYWVYNDVDVNLDAIHKATVDELIEHFKTKEER
jgi:sporulation protein YlmC with PRC-barrel domain